MWLPHATLRNPGTPIAAARIAGGRLVSLATALILAGCSGTVPGTISVAPASVTPPASSSGAVSGGTSAATSSTGPVGSPSVSVQGLAGPTAGQPVEPNPSLTPGSTSSAVTQATIRTTICVSGYTRTVRPPASYTSALKVRQIAQYGYADTNPHDYEEDHLISLELGGAPRDPANLWPEPWTIVASNGNPAGARVKDRFENYLHAQVCTGRLTLATAQRQIARDWFDAWIAAGRP